MQLRWLRHAGSADVAVVFGGWGVGPEALGTLAGARDVLFASDYRALDAPLPDLSGYARRDLVAWSFGVASYAHWQAARPDPFTTKTAICGSLSPVSRDTGIPPAAFARTLDTLSAESFGRFLGRVYGTTPPAVPDFDLADRRAELQAVAARGNAPDPGFDRVWVATADRIFPPANLARAWAGGPVWHIHAPHAPFALFTGWGDILP